MKLVPESSPLPRLLILAIAVLTAGALVFARLFPEILLQVAHCPLREATGIPCPTCGGTRCALALAAGRWPEAFLANPLVAGCCLLGALGAGYAGVAALVPSARRDLRLGPREKRAARILAALAVLVTWAYLAMSRAGGGA